MEFPRQPVFAIVPNFNMAKGLERSLPLLKNAGYDAICVLDDVSTDGGESCQVVADIGDVHWIPGTRNSGSGANRNRIVGWLNEKHWQATLHFTDADCKLETPNAPEIIRDIMADESRLIVGGLVKTAAGRQSEWNYGPRLSLHTGLSSLVQAMTHDKPAVRQRFPNLLRDWPDPNVPLPNLVPRPVFWVNEANLVIYSGTLKKFGGFGEGLGDHDIQPLVLEIAKSHKSNTAAGAPCSFDPLFAVTQHDDINVRSGNRELQKVLAEIKIIRRFGGLGAYFLPDGRFRPELLALEDTN